jgi:predicted nucleotidyltransferase
MAESINYRLQQLANKYYISSTSPENAKILTSVTTLKTRLKSYFGNDISSVEEFGSYKRDTILPRLHDENSDVDLMIMFNHSVINVNPSTYRKRLHEFADKYYASSEAYKSKPTVVLQLNHIKYDLVPAHQEYSSWRGTTTYIPESDTGWMTTDPHGFNNELTEKNKNNNNHIRPVIRLLKAWNAKAGYPIESFSLEKEIVGQTYWGQKTLEEYFFSAIDGLTTYRYGTFTPKSKIEALKENASRVKSALQSNNVSSALLWLGHILPL